MSFKMDNDCRYAETHEWIRVDGDVGLVGITDYAQHQLNDVVYVELPEIGDSFGKSDVYAVVESVKAAADCSLPASGEILEVNEGLEDRPQSVNEDPFGDGWFVKVRLTDVTELDGLMDATAYEKLVEEELEGEGGH